MLYRSNSPKYFSVFCGSNWFSYLELDFCRVSSILTNDSLDSRASLIDSTNVFPFSSPSYDN